MFQRYNIIVILSLLSISALISCSSTTSEILSKKERDMKFNNLLELHDRSERAFMYHHYCLSDEPINENFMKNFTTVSNILLDEAIEKMRMPPEIIVKRILIRRKIIQQQLSDYYHSFGCQSEEAGISKTHYDAFSKFNEKQVNSLINSADKV